MGQNDGSGSALWEVSHPSCPREGRVWLADQNGAPVFCLFPFLLFMDGDFWFMNGWETPEVVEFLCYDTGFLQRLTIDAPSILRTFSSPPSHEKTPFPRVEIIQGNVWDLTVDAAIMAQDRFRVFGPTGDLTPPEFPVRETIQALTDLEGLDPGETTPGDVILSRRPWCASRYLLEVIVYDLESSPVTDMGILETGLRNAFVLAGDLAVESLGLGPMGTQYQVISPEAFADLLVRSMEKQARAIASVQRLVIALPEEDDIVRLRGPLAHRLGGNVFPG